MADKESPRKGQALSWSILLLDDDARWAEQYAVGLRTQGYRVETAHISTAALRAMERGRFDVCLIDWKLSENDISGLDVLKAVRKRWPHVITIMISGFASGSAGLEASRLGVHAFVDKPFPPSDMHELIRSITEEVSDDVVAKVQAKMRGEFKLTPLTLNSAAKGILRKIEQGFDTNLSAADIGLLMVDSDHWERRSEPAFIDAAYRRAKRAFMKVVGVSPMAYLKEMRLRVGRELMCLTKLSISEVCVKSGINDSSTFIRGFQNRFGMTPGVTRKQAQRG